MSAPNIIVANTIFGKTSFYTTNTVLTPIVTNATNSGQLLKLNSVTFANSNANNVPLWLDIQRGAGSYWLGCSVTVPGYSTLVVVAKDTSIYLEEGDVLRANTGSQGTCSVVTSYELIS